MRKKIMTTAITAFMIISLISVITVAPVSAQDGSVPDRETVVTQAADRLVALQSEDAEYSGWDRTITDLLSHSGGSSDPSMYGTTGLGLVAAYRITSNPAYLAAAIKAAAYPHILGNRLSFDRRFLHELSEISGDPSYAESAEANWYALTTSFTAQDCYDFYVGQWVELYGGLWGAAFWEISEWALEAYLFEDETWAEDAIALMLEDIDDVTEADITRFVGWGHLLRLLQTVDPDTYADEIEYLVGELEDSQDPSGYWMGPNHRAQDTAYAIMGLASVDPESASVRRGCAWLVANQGYDTIEGGWYDELGEPYECPEYNAEVIEALEATPAPVTIGEMGYYSIQQAIDSASPGDTVLVGPGTYDPFIVSEKEDLTIKSASEVIVKGVQSVGTNYTDRDAVVFVKGSSNIALEGLDIQGEGLGTINAKNYGVIYESSSGTIENCTVSPNTIGDMLSIAIGIWDGSDVTIDPCVIKNFGRVGVFVYNGCTVGVYDSTIEGQVYSGEGEVCYGIEVEGAYNDATLGTASNVTIVGNEIYNCNNTFTPAPTWESAGIYINGWMEYFAEEDSTVTIENNDIYNNYDGIYAVKSSKSYAHHNNITGNREYGVVSAVAYDYTSTTFDATLNWWEDPSGPNGVGLGSGDAVSANVDYRPWLRMPVGEDETPPTIEDALAIPDMISLITSTDGMSTGPEYTYLVVEVVETYGLGNVTLNFRPMLEQMFANVEFEDQDAWEDFLGYYAEVGMELQDGLWVRGFYSWEPIEWLFGYYLVEEDEMFRILSEEIVLGDFTIPVTFSGYYHVYDEFGNPVQEISIDTGNIELAIVDLMVPLEEGWNLRSTPVALANPRWGDITSLGQGDSLSYDVALRLDVETQEWEVVDSDYPLKPLEAIYIHATERDQIGLIFSRGQPALLTRQLEPGWNLVGYAPPVDIWCEEGANFGWDEMHVREAMVSIEETPDGNTGYDIVMSPGESFEYDEYFVYDGYDYSEDGCYYFEGVYYKYFDQDSWVYTAKPWEYDVYWDYYYEDWDYRDDYYMEPFCGYKVFMENPDLLAGFNETPLTWDYWY